MTTPAALQLAAIMIPIRTTVQWLVVVAAMIIIAPIAITPAAAMTPIQIAARA